MTLTIGEKAGKIKKGKTKRIRSILFFATKYLHENNFVLEGIVFIETRGIMFFLCGKVELK